MFNMSLFSKHGYFFFLSVLEQDKHVTKCSSYIETIQPARIMTKCLPLYETKPPSQLVWKDGSNLCLSERCRSDWVATVNSAGDSQKKGKCRFGLLRSKGIWYGKTSIHFTTGQQKGFQIFYTYAKNMQPCLLWITSTCTNVWLVCRANF